MLVVCGRPATILVEAGVGCTETGCIDGVGGAYAGVGGAYAGGGAGVGGFSVDSPTA